MAIDEPISVKLTTEALNKAIIQSGLEDLLSPDKDDDEAMAKMQALLEAVNNQQPEGENND